MTDDLDLIGDFVTRKQVCQTTQHNTYIRISCEATRPNGCPLPGYFSRSVLQYLNPTLRSMQSLATPAAALVLRPWR